MKTVYLAHPLGGGPDREKNRRNAAKWAAWAAVVKGVSPSCSWVVLSGELDESFRDIGIACDLALLEQCDEVWLVGGRTSPGMAIEAAHANRCNIPVMNLFAMGYDAPSLNRDVRATADTLPPPRPEMPTVDDRAVLMRDGTVSSPEASE